MGFVSGRSTDLAFPSGVDLGVALNICALHANGFEAWVTDNGGENALDILRVFVLLVLAGACRDYLV